MKESNYSSDEEDLQGHEVINIPPPNEQNLLPPQTEIELKPIHSNSLDETIKKLKEKEKTKEKKLEKKLENQTLNNNIYNNNSNSNNNNNNNNSINFNINNQGNSLCLKEGQYIFEPCIDYPTFESINKVDINNYNQNDNYYQNQNNNINPPQIPINNNQIIKPDYVIPPGLECSSHENSIIGEKSV